MMCVITVVTMVIQFIIVGRNKHVITRLMFRPTIMMSIIMRTIRSRDISTSSRDNIIVSRDPIDIHRDLLITPHSIKTSNLEIPSMLGIKIIMMLIIKLLLLYAMLSMLMVLKL